ncbi:MAG: thioredoxin [Alphaproteobacteria bacterium]|nr:thioredoxin [Alphaproteobacteria bacterium]MDX5368611.1 thioredoxin [Alphaproteobacteria bacterium]MDX5463356.1 thioredoxin [Alphaproteobacteria bacterium]
MALSFGGGFSGQRDGGQGSEAAGAAALITDATVETFARDVLEASKEAVVLVDFWAPWCGPCKQLTPVLEKVVKQAGGKVRLVKVNIDENQMLAQQMRIQSIPAVYAFQNGQPVDGFMGALPESQVKAFIDSLVGPAGPDPVEQALDAAEAAAPAQPEQAAQLFARVLQHDPQNIRAIGGLAKCYLKLDQPDRAREILDMAPAEAATDPAIQSAKTALDLAEQAGKAGDPRELAARVEADPNDHGARFDLATALLALGDREDAINHLLEIVRRDREWNEGAARARLLELFEAFGPKDPLTHKGRMRLSSILFA